MQRVSTTLSLPVTKKKSQTLNNVYGSSMQSNIRENRIRTRHVLQLQQVDRYNLRTIFINTSVLIITRNQLERPVIRVLREWSVTISLEKHMRTIIQHCRQQGAHVRPTMVVYNCGKKNTKGCRWRNNPCS